MARECKIRIQIGTGSIIDAKTTYGIHLIDSDDIIIPPVKDYEVQRYPESAAEEIHPYTTYEPFDYKCTLLLIGSLTTVNASIRTFYDAMFTITSGVDLRQANVITLYNDYKGVKVTGYVKTADPKEYYPKLVEYEKGAYLFDFVLHVSDPKTLISL